MSAEKIAPIGKENLETPQFNKQSFESRVDINNLLARAREREKKENKTNLVFFFLVTTLIFIIGIILSF